MSRLPLSFCTGQDAVPTNRGLVLGIDPGWRHLGLCLFDPNSQVVLSLQNADVFDGKPFNGAFLFENLAKCLRPYRDLNIEKVIIEKQFDNARNMVRVEAFIAGYFADTCMIVHPRTLKAALLDENGNNLLTGVYDKNKAAAVAFATWWFGDSAPPIWTHATYALKKDMADALLQVIYYEEHVRPLMARSPSSSPTSRPPLGSRSP